MDYFIDGDVDAEINDMANWNSNSVSAPDPQDTNAILDTLVSMNDQKSKIEFLDITHNAGDGDEFIVTGERDNRASEWDSFLEIFMDAQNEAFMNEINQLADRGMTSMENGIRADLEDQGLASTHFATPE